MATLQSIGQSGLVGTAPTPVLQRAINTYLVNDPLMNICRFVNNGTPDNLQNFQTSFVYYDGASSATFRALGVDYAPDNAKPLTGTVMLKMLGGRFEADIEVARAFGTNPGAVSNWTEQQIAQQLNGITNSFAKAFMQGDSSTRPTEFDGLNKKIVSTQIINDAVDVYALDDAKALQAEVAINKLINKIHPKRPNVIITTYDGKAILSALNAYRHRGVDAIDVNGQAYDQYMGIPIVPVTDDCFTSEDTTKGIPVVFALFDELDGVRVCIPMDGQVVIIVPPKFDNGKVVETGACEMCCAPLFANPFAVAKGYLKDTNE